MPAGLHRRRWVAALVVGIGTLASPAGAWSATSVGQSPPTAGTGQIGCSSGSGALDAVQRSVSDGNGYTIPAGGGVITSWRTSNSAVTPAQIKLRVFTDQGSSFTAVGESSVEAVHPDSPQSFASRVPVNGGELLGFSIASAGSNDCLFTTTGSTADVVVAAASGLLNEPRTAGPPVTDARVNVSANLEPDADKDGFGDETQDACPTDASTQGACPPPPEPLTCGGKVPTLMGTDGADRLRGTFAKDVIYAGAGDDVVKGRDGNDVICGGDGRDELNGGGGKDTLLGDASKDKLVGAGGKDKCDGGAGKDIAESCEKGPDS